MNFFRSLVAAATFVICNTAAVVSAAPVADAYSSFNATQGAGGFTYGSFTGTFDAATSTFVGATFTNFNNNTNCAFTGSICLNDADPARVPQASKSTTPSFQYGTVDVPDDRLVLHPGQNNSVFVRYTASTDFDNVLDAVFSVQDRFPTGVEIYLFTTVNGDPDLYGYSLGTLTAPNQTITFSEPGHLAVGETVGFIITNGGNYSNDSIGVNVTVNDVPEPGSLALALAALGGVAATPAAAARAAWRRRRQQHKQR